MGLADRDYMRERHRRERSVVTRLGPPEPSAATTLWMLVLFSALTYGGYKAWQWWYTKPPVASARPAPRAVDPRLPGRAAQPGPTPSDQVRQPVRQSVPASQRDTTIQVTKCVSKGVTIYSDVECADHMRSARLSVNTEQNLSDGLPPAAARQALRVVQAEPAPAPLAASPHVQKRAQCLAYEEEIKAIDARARQPLSGGEQDYLAAKRKAARDQQFRLRCQ